MARSHPGLPYGRTLRDLVRAGKLGTVTYVTASDRRRAVAAGGQLAEVGLQQLDELAQLFDGSASRIMARLVPERTEAWLDLGNGTRVHYDGALAADVDAHELWIDGAEGALRVAHGCLFWRRRGWRWFVPIGVRSRPLAGAAGESRRAALREAALESDRSRALVSLPAARVPAQ
jgi:predicted dehydrogenase